MSIAHVCLIRHNFWACEVSENVQIHWFRFSIANSIDFYSVIIFKFPIFLHYLYFSFIKNTLFEAFWLVQSVYLFCSLKKILFKIKFIYCDTFQNKRINNSVIKNIMNLMYCVIIWDLTWFKADFFPEQSTHWLQAIHSRPFQDKTSFHM